MNKEDQIPVLVAGANGKMGREVVQTVLQQVDMRLAAALGHARGLGEDVGVVAQGEACGVALSDNIEECTQVAAGGVLVDFTLGPVVKDIVLSALRHNMACVIGTTSIPPADLAEVEEASRTCNQPVLLAPNFALGAVLMMKFAREASKYFRWAEIIELHHEKKMDAPSGTARRTAELMRKSRSDGFRAMAQEEESVKGCRGGSIGGVRIHSVRLPGLLAHQQVMFGSHGETLMIQHDARARNAYMPGVILAIQRVRNLTGLVEGLEHVLDP
ncbi:4-hydroxy-tetrahydrodipicolinate reductase [bacterium]|nr:4-hydroxy-tetrahydrodipicolinate reductase [bacterium]